MRHRTDHAAVSQRAAIAEPGLEFDILGAQFVRVSQENSQQGIRFAKCDASGNFRLDDVMGDKVDAIKPVLENPAVLLESDTGLSHMAVDHVTKIRRTQRMVTGKSKIKDYNDRTPSVNIIGSATKPGQGEAYDYGPNVLTASEAGQVATLRTEMFACGKILLEGEGLCRDFRSGYRFDL